MVIEQPTPSIESGDNRQSLLKRLVNYLFEKNQLQQQQMFQKKKGLKPGDILLADRSLMLANIIDLIIKIGIEGKIIMVTRKEERQKTFQKKHALLKKTQVQQ